MSQPTAVDYLSKLSDLMLGTQVTSRSRGILSLDEGSEMAIQMVLDTGAASRKIMLIGNGGSSAVVSHVQNDLCKAVGVRALVFTEQPLLTALANDDGYGSVYERPIQLWAEHGDLLIAVSSSGRSDNIVRAVQAAQAKECSVITFTGFSPENPCRQMGDLNFHVASDVYGFVETAHAALAHFVTDRARATLRAPLGAVTKA